MSDLQRIFKENIKRFRSLKKMSQGELAQVTSIAQARMSRIENSDADVGILTIEKIAKGLGINPTELLIDSSVQKSTFEEKVLKANSLNEYERKIIEGVVEGFLEKNRLEALSNIKMKERLIELSKLKRTD